jgi:acetolactate synthase-1/2/3 large subunit
LGHDVGAQRICWDAGIQEDQLKGDVPIPNVAKLMPATPIQGDLEALGKLAEMLVDAKNPLILTDYTGRNPESFHNLVKLAELLAIPVMDFRWILIAA